MPAQKSRGKSPGFFVSPEIYLSVILAATWLSGDAVGEGEEDAGDDKNEMDDDESEDLPLGLRRHRFQGHEPLQEVDCGNRYDGREQLLLERAEIDGAHPIGPVFVAGVIDLGDEVFVAGKNHDDEERDRRARGCRE